MTETRILGLASEAGDPGAVGAVGAVLRSGGIVAFPTETVYGLAALGASPEAVDRLYRVKERPREKHLSYVIGSAAAVENFVNRPSRPARRLMDAFWPGPLTLVFRTGRATVGVRLPDHAFARAVAETLATPLVLTSANRSGSADLVTGSDVIREFQGQVDLIVDGGPTRLRCPSSVVEVEGERWSVLREGAIPRSAIARSLVIRVLLVCTGNTCRSPMAAALLRRRLAGILSTREPDLAGAGISVESAGVGAMPAAPASDGALLAMSRRGIDLGSHRSRRLTPALVRDADRIVGLTPAHCRAAAEIAGDAAAPIALLAPEPGIDDPFGGSPDEYEACAAAIEAAVAPLADSLIAEFGLGPRANMGAPPT